MGDWHWVLQLLWWVVFLPEQPSLQELPSSAAKVSLSRPIVAWAVSMPCKTRRLGPVPRTARRAMPELLVTSPRVTAFSLLKVSLALLPTEAQSPSSFLIWPRYTRVLQMVLPDSS